jgi:hypothetical protein
MKDSISLKTFVFQIQPYFPLINYKRAIAWVDDGILPVWPRRSRERIAVKVSQLPDFFKSFGISEEEAKSIISRLHF